MTRHLAVYSKLCRDGRVETYEISTVLRRPMTQLSEERVLVSLMVVAAVVAVVGVVVVVVVLSEVYTLSAGRPAREAE